MMELLFITQGIIERGLIFGMVTLSVYLAARVIHFNNLSIEGAFGLGGAVAALLLSWHINPWLTLLGALAVGALAGITVALLHTKLLLSHLISGIVVATGAFSVMLKIAGSNMTLSGKTTLFSLMPTVTTPYNPLILLTLLFCALFFALSWFLKTEIGFLLQAVGDTPQMVTNVGKSINLYIIMGLALSNAFAALSGALFVHYTGYFSIWTSVGMLVIGLASMILAETITHGLSIALLFGSIAYQIIIALTCELQVDQEWNKLITALLIVSLIVAKQQFSKK